MFRGLIGGRRKEDLTIHHNVDQTVHVKGAHRLEHGQILELKAQYSEQVKELKKGIEDIKKQIDYYSTEVLHEGSRCDNTNLSRQNPLNEECSASWNRALHEAICSKNILKMHTVSWALKNGILIKEPRNSELANQLKSELRSLQAQLSEAEKTLAAYKAGELGSAENAGNGTFHT